MAWYCASLLIPYLFPRDIPFLILNADVKCFVFELLRWHLDEYDHNNSEYVQLTSTWDIFRIEFHLSTRSILLQYFTVPWWCSSNSSLIGWVFCPSSGAKSSISLSLFEDWNAWRLRCSIISLCTESCSTWHFGTPFTIWSILAWTSESVCLFAGGCQLLGSLHTDFLSVECDDLFLESDPSFVQEYPLLSHLYFFWPLSPNCWLAQCHTITPLLFDKIPFLCLEQFTDRTTILYSDHFSISFLYGIIRGSFFFAKRGQHREVHRVHSCEKASLSSFLTADSSPSTVDLSSWEDSIWYRNLVHPYWLWMLLCNFASNLAPPEFAWIARKFCGLPKLSMQFSSMSMSEPYSRLLFKSSSEHPMIWSNVQNHFANKCSV